jgi:ribosome recycling factor
MIIQNILTQLRNQLSKDQQELNRLLKDRSSITLNISYFNSFLLNIDNISGPLNYFAVLNQENPTTVSVAPWDKKNIPKIEKILSESDLHLNMYSNDGKIFLSFPKPTKERREEIVKSLKKIVDQYKVMARSHRKNARDLSKDIQDTLTKDELFKFKEDIDLIVQTATQEYENLFIKYNEITLKI